MTTRPRIRTLKPETWADEKIGRLSRDARLLFVGLVTMADDEGRFRALPPAICGHVFPYDEDAARKVERWLRELEGQGLVERYEADGFTYGALRGWARHQRITRPTRSELPIPPGHDPSPGPDPAPCPQQPHRRAIPEATRREVARRAGGVPGETTPAECHYCGAPGQIHWPRLTSGRAGSWVKFVGLDLDHVLAAVNGGGSEAANVVLACAKCNRTKGARDGTEWARDEHVSRNGERTGARHGEVA